MYGSSVIKLLDQYAAYKFASGEKINSPSMYGWNYSIYEWKQWLKAVGAGVIAATLLLCAIKFVNQPEKLKHFMSGFTIFFGSWLFGLFAGLCGIHCFPKSLTRKFTGYNKSLKHQSLRSLDSF